MSNDILAFIIAILGAYISMNYIVDRWQYLFGVGVGLVVAVIGHVGRVLGTMRIMNHKVYGLEESLVRSGYPLSTTINEDLKGFVGQYGVDAGIKRGKKLGNTKAGEGHDKFLRGIIVQFDMVAPRYFWQEWDTYHFIESTSSQSTMHCITKFDVESMCNPYVLVSTIENLNVLIADYNEDRSTKNLLRVKSNIPEGLELGRGISTNYASLKTMYNQRKNHRLPEWSEVSVDSWNVCRILTNCV